MKKTKYMKRVAILLSILMMAAPGSLVAQTPLSSDNEASKRTGVSARAQEMSAAATADMPKQLSLKLADGEKILLRNRFGPVVVTGTGGDTLEASVSLLRGGVSEYKFKVATSRHGKERIMISTAVISPEQSLREKYKEDKAAATGRATGTAVTKQGTPQPGQPAQPSQAPQQPRPRPGAQGAGGGTPMPRRPQRTPELSESSPPELLRNVRDIKLEVRLPRNTRIELIDTRRYAVVNAETPTYLTNTRNDVSVTNMETSVSVVSSGEVQISKVAAVEVRTRSGGVQVRDVKGPVSISTVMGAIVIRDADGDVRAVSISGPISVECARGRAEASTTTGIINLTGIGGDLEANTTGGTITFTGAIRNGGRYRLKSMSGLVRMLIQKEPPGFLSSLSSYKGQVMMEFDLKTELSANTATTDLPSTQGQTTSRRLTGRYGEGDARITLDSFSGTVQLGRAPSETWKKCQ